MKYLIELGRHLWEKDNGCRRQAFLGNCRVWTRMAFLESWRWTQEKGLLVTIEAREKQVISCLDHTFLRVTLGEEKYIYDGTGFSRQPAWYGREGNSWYEGSHQDMIQVLLEEEVKMRGGMIMVN